ncbi:hypothetical protein WN55_11412 [Dufourea novaeangliae]|uniref:Uncharacterized protein n=1 Tax=Dufourea novaeangliae TaxID=178035 RepID=A0A154PAL6_DUFNO|nr:hypothetical protein WN55_11412 [Dufourea novaeangliae]
MATKAESIGNRRKAKDKTLELFGVRKESETGMEKRIENMVGERHGRTEEKFRREYGKNANRDEG